MTLAQSVTSGHVCTCCDERLMALVEVTGAGTRTLVAVCPRCDYAVGNGPIQPRPRTAAAPPADQRWVLE